MKKIALLLFLLVPQLSWGSVAVTIDGTTHDLTANSYFNVPTGLTETIESGGSLVGSSGSTINFSAANFSTVGINWGLPRLGLDANGTALKASTGAYTGQLGMSRDGYLSYWNGSSWDTGNFNMGATLATGVLGLPKAAINQPVARSDGGVSNYLQYTRFTATGNAYVDNTVEVTNLSTNPAGTSGGFAAVTCGSSVSGPFIHDGLFFTFGVPGIWGVTSPSNEYGTGGYIATNPLQAATITTAMPFGLFQEKQDSGGGYYQHRRIYFDSSFGMTAYGKTENNNVGPVGWFVDPSGIVCIGGNTVSGTAALQITGVARESGITSSFVGSDSAGKHVATTTTLGDLPYAGASGAPSRLAGNTTTTPQLLTQTGTGSVSAAPAWANPSAVQGLPRLGLDANGTALQASTGSYTGQLAMARDGGIAFWNGTNWNGTLTFIKPVNFADPIQMFNGLSMAIGNISFATAGAGLVGTTTNNSANAGNVGEFVSTLTASGSAVSLSTGTSINVNSIVLSGGDWDVEGNINYIQTAATVTSKIGSISSTSLTLSTDGSEVYSGANIIGVTTTDGLTLPRKRISIPGPTTIYLVAQSTFSAGTVTAFGSINARRVR